MTMDYAEVLAAQLRSPEEKLRAARLAQSVTPKTAERWQPEYEKEPGLELVNPEDWVPGPGMVKAMALKAAATVKGLAMAGGAGIIRKGGNPDLVAVHQTSPRKLWPWVSNDRLPENLTAPSIAVNNGRITQDFGDNSGTITLVARPDVLDPAKIEGRIWPRDVYTPRQEAFVAAELAGKPLGRRDMVLGENALPDSPAHELSMRLSPAFRSYKDFEEHPAGAAVLSGGEHPQDLQNFQHAWQSDLWKQLEQSFPQGMPAQLGDGATQFYRKMQEALFDGQMSRKQAQAYGEFIRGYRNLPSEYAEQKVFKPVGVNGGNWAGMVIRENPELQKAAETAALTSPLHRQAGYSSKEAVERLIQAASARGIPTITTRHPEEEYYLARWLSEQAK